MNSTPLSEQYDIIIEMQMAVIRELHPKHEAEKIISKILKKVAQSQVKGADNERTMQPDNITP